jgi:hypothetical protein
LPIITSAFPEALFNREQTRAVPAGRGETGPIGVDVGEGRIDAEAGGIDPDSSHVDPEPLHVEAGSVGVDPG